MTRVFSIRKNWAERIYSQVNALLLELRETELFLKEETKSARKLSIDSGLSAIELLAFNRLQNPFKISAPSCVGLFLGKF